MLAPLAYILRMRTVPLRNLGGCMSPDNAWMALQGIETLPMRMEKHCARRRPFPSSRGDGVEVVDAPLAPQARTP